MSKEIRERYEEARSAWSEWRTRAEEDLRFSNPANPQQWAQEVINARGRSRPVLVFDQTNQYISQVVNDARQNKPSIDVLPGDSFASDKAAEVYGGLIRQIEYASRAQIAYDTAIEYAARIGLGFILVVPELVDGRANDHDVRIKSVVNPISATLDPDSVEPDGNDADCGWLETRMSDAAFKRRWPRAKKSSFAGDAWFDGGGIKVLQYFERTYKSSNTIVTADGREWGEDDYHAENKRTGVKLPVHDTFMREEAKVIWQHLSGEEVLEETEYPAPFIGLVPVYGNVLWVDGKRQVCGMTRRMMDACRAYNYARSAEIESTALMPKAPWVAPAAAIAKYQARWEKSNVENAAVLPWDHLDPQGLPIPEPRRQDPPQIGSAFPMLSQQALQDVQASVGMFKSDLGQNSNAKTGIAISRLQQAGDTATYHYNDNLNRSVEQVGRICVALIPTYYDRERVARILKVDGKPASVQINPDLKTAHEQGDILQVNPAVGAYDVRVKAGPSYTSMRQEMADKLVQLGQGNPPLAAALSPLVLDLADMPGADKATKVAMALLPPEVRAAYDEENENTAIPPQLAAQMQQMGEQMQHMHDSGAQIQAERDELATKITQLEGKLVQEQSKRAMTEVDLRVLEAQSEIKATLDPDAGANLQTENEQLQAQLRDAEKQLLEERAQRLEAEIGAREAEALLNIERAEKESLARVQDAMQPTAEAVSEPEPAATNIITFGQPGMEQLPAALAHVGNALTMAQEQLEMLAAGQATMGTALAEIGRPKVSSITFAKQPDGSFAGQRVEE